MAQTTPTNRKKIMVPTTMSRSGWALIEARDDVEAVEFAPTIAEGRIPQAARGRERHLPGRARRSATPRSTPRRMLEVVARIGVGYDAVDVPALTRRNVPLMIGGTANSVSVAEAGVS